MYLHSNCIELFGDVAKDLAALTDEVKDEAIQFLNRTAAIIDILRNYEFVKSVSKSKRKTLSKADIIDSYLQKTYRSQNLDSAGFSVEEFGKIIVIKFQQSFKREETDLNNVIKVKVTIDASNMYVEYLFIEEVEKSKNKCEVSVYS